MFSFTRLKFWIFVTCAAILCQAGELGAVRCDRCSCVVETAPPDQSDRRSILYVNCTKSGVSDMVPVPNLDAFKYTDIEADFESNKITTVQYNIFSGFPVTKLNLANNEIRNIPEGGLSKMPDLKELNLSNNKLVKSLNAKTFKGLESLEYLDLSGNKLMQLDSTVFYSLQALKSLKLCMNFLKELPSDLFISVRNLEVLHLHQNAITSVNKVTFQTLDRLQHLDISGNNIGELDEEIFEVSTQLLTLNLSSNNLTTLGKSTFKMLTMLRSLNLSNNQISAVVKEMALPKTLRYLNVGHNRIKESGMLFQNFHELQELHLEDNNFANLDVVKSYTKLRVLNVSSNTLKSFPLQTYPLLRVLDLSNNLFPSIPPVVTGQYLPSLNQLSLDANPLQDLKFPSTKSTFTNLTYVSLSNLAAIREIPARAFTTLASRTSGRYVEEAVEDKEPARKKREDTTTDLTSESKTIILDPTTENSEVTPKGTDDLEAVTTMSSPADVSLGEVTGAIKTETKGPDFNKDEVKTSRDNMETVSVTIPVETVSVTIPVVVDNQTSGEKQQTRPPCGSRKTVGCRSSKELTSKEVNEELDASERGPKPEDKEEAVESGKEEVLEEMVTKSVYTALKEGNRRMMDEEGKQRMGALRKETVPQVMQYENIPPAETRGCEKGLTLRIAMNKNLMKIHEDAFKGIDICELDLSSNSLTSLPENALDWNVVRSVDLQHNPWDCSCKLQWLLNIIVPKLYREKPDLLYELRCARPAALSDLRFVHFYNWTESAFCMDRKYESMKKGTTDTEIVNENVSLGSSNGMFISLGICMFIIVALVVLGVAYQWRVVNRRNRRRNRRS